MAHSLFDFQGVARVSLSSTDHAWIAYLNGKGAWPAPSYANNPTIEAPDFLPAILKSGTFSGVASHASAFSGSGAIQKSQSLDYHFRIWVVPSILNLSNPAIGSDIPFRLWNTFPTSQSLSSILVSGSSVLGFDLNPGDSILDFQYREVNLTIGEGEAQVDADVSFVFPGGTGLLHVLALVAETFPLIPEVPVTERWDFTTNVLTNYKGVETRIALMPNPRISLEFSVKVVDFAERRALYDLTASNIKVPSLVPLFQYAAPITAQSATGTSRFYFDPALSNLRVGTYVVILNRSTRQTVLGTVTMLHPDGCTLNSTTSVDVDPGLWFLMPAISCIVSDDTGLDFGTQAGTFSLKAETLGDFELERPGAVATVDQFDSLPVIDRVFLITQPEKFAYRREVLDGGVGIQELRSRDDSFVVRKSFKFPVSRLDDSFDYWRAFFKQVNGGQKPFLVSTQLPDLTLTTAPAQGSSQLRINEKYYETKLYPNDAFKRIRLEYESGLHSYHVVTLSSTDALGQTTLSISPAMPDDVDHAVVTRISFLHKMVASDTITLEHYNDFSYLKFSARSTNN